MRASRPLSSFSHLRQLFVFGTVGLIATAIQYAVLLVTVQALHLRPLLGSSLGFVLSSVVNYLLNYHLTFRSQAPQLRAASRFAFVALTGLALNDAVMALLAQQMRVHYLLAQLTATAVVFTWTYLANSRWAFAWRNGHPVPPASVPAEPGL